MVRALIVIVLVVTVFSCKKDDEKTDGIRPEDKERAAALTTMLQTDSFRLTDYYANEAIDYIDTDQVVKAETDLWPYVSAWLHDDAYTFSSNGSLTIHQGASRIPTNGSGTISKNYSVQADKDGVAFNFVGHEYQDLKYRLESFNDTLLKVSATWNGKTVFSEYTRLP